MVEIYIGGIKIDLKEQNIVQTFQINDVGKLDRAQTSYTNSFKIPRTSTNEEIFQYIGIPTKEIHYSAVEFPYGIKEVSLYENGMEIVRNGFAYLFDITEEYYNISIYGAEKSFFDTLKTKTIQDIYPSGLTIGYDTSSISHYMDGSDLDIVFAYCKYNSKTEYYYQPHEMHIEILGAVPQFFIYRFFDYIFSDLGYTVDHDLLSIPEFKQLVVNSTETADSLGINWGGTEQVKQFIPPLGADVFLKEILTRYGLVIKVDERAKNIILKNIDEILTDIHPIDWSEKFEGIKKQTFKNNEFAINNLYKYAQDEVYAPEGGYATGDPQWSAGITTEGELQGSFGIEDDTIQIEKTQVTSVYKKPIIYETDRTAFSPGYLGAIDLRAYEGFDVNTKATLDVNQYLMHLVVYLDPGILPLRLKVFYTTTIDTTIIDTTVTTLSLLEYKDTNFQGYLDLYYSKFIEMLNNYRKFNVLIRLTSYDIYTLDLLKPIHINQLGADFYINRVINYKEGKLTEVELIKIPVDINIT